MSWLRDWQGTTSFNESTTMSDTPAEIKDDNSIIAAEQPKKKKEKKKPRKRGSKKALPKTKVVVRRLPPNIPPEIFNKSVQQWINDTTVDWQLFVPGKLSSR
jgi:regulator of nonsense transcripts 3